MNKHSNKPSFWTLVGEQVILALCALGFVLVVEIYNLLVS